LQKK
jgi:hypothetical protein